jgi:Sec-independent protein translocase protein TatA
MGRSLGKGMREFKDSISGKDDEPVELPPPQDEAPVPAGTSRNKTTTPS